MSQRHVPVERLPASGTAGLCAAQVEHQRAYGFNDIVAHAAGGWLLVARETARDPTLWSLVLSERDTRSAREAAPLVLLDDNFRTIVDAVGKGRQLFQNLQLAFASLLLVHLPLVIGAAAIPLMGQPSHGLARIPGSAGAGAARAGAAPSARAMALTVLLVATAAVTTALPKLRQPTAPVAAWIRWRATASHCVASMWATHGGLEWAVR